MFDQLFVEMSEKLKVNVLLTLTEHTLSTHTDVSIFVENIEIFDTPIVDFTHFVRQSDFFWHKFLHNF